MKKLSIFIISITLIGCAMTGHLKPLGFFSLTPIPRTFDSKVTIPITIIISDNIDNSPVVSIEGMYGMQVTDFRNSLLSSLLNTFSNNFTKVNSNTALSNQGLELIVKSMRPKWVTKNRGYFSSFEYETTLYLDGVKISKADGIGESDYQTIISNPGQAQPLFKNGLTNTCKDIHNSLFTDEILLKIK